MNINSNPRNYTWLVYLTLIFAVISRIHAEWMVPDFGSDKIMQIATAHNFIKGNGISISYVEPDDLSKIVFEPIGLWPPGLVLGIAPLISSGLTTMQASTVLETIAIILFFSAFFFLFKLIALNNHYWIQIGFFIFYGLSLQPFNFLNTSGLIALSFFSLAVCALVWNLTRNSGLFDWFALGIFSFLPSLFHFSYYPISISLPLIFLAYAFFLDKSKQSKAVLNSVVCIVLISIQLFYQFSLPTGINYLNSYHPVTSAAPYWENLLMFINLPLNLISDGYLVKRTLNNVNPYIYSKVGVVLWVALAVATIYLGRDFIINLKRKGVSYLTSPLPQFKLISTGISLLLIFFLIFLSLKYPAADAHWMPNNLWTYVTEARYFAPVIVLVPITITIALCKASTARFVKAGLLSLLIIGLLFSTSVRIFHIQKYGSGTFKGNYAAYYHHSLDVERFLEEKSNECPNLIYAQSSATDPYEYYSKLKNIPILKYADLNSTLGSSEPVKILFTRNDNLSHYDNHLVDSLIHSHSLKAVQDFPVLEIKFYELNIP